MRSARARALVAAGLVGVAAAAAAVLSGCSGGDGGAAGNPSRLWLAPDGSELEVKLQDHEPPPF